MSLREAIEDALREAIGDPDIGYPTKWSRQVEDAVWTWLDDNELVMAEAMRDAIGVDDAARAWLPEARAVLAALSEASA